MDDQMLDCLRCGKETNGEFILYMGNPGHIIVPTTYALCAEHKDLRYDFSDIYTSNGKRHKKIDHIAVERKGSIKCPKCGAVSFNRGDIQHRYCGRCHDWHDNMKGVVLHKSSSDFQRGARFFLDCFKDMVNNKPSCTLEDVKEILNTFKLPSEIEDGQETTDSI